MNDIEQVLVEVALQRKALVSAEDWMASRRAFAELTPEWLDYEAAREIMTDAKDALSAAEAAARIAILAEYESTGSKAPAKGAGVRVLRKATYVLADALAWCRQNAPALLTVDEKKFVKADLDGAPIEWIETPTATIAADLSIYEVGE